MDAQTSVVGRISSLLVLLFFGRICCKEKQKKTTTIEYHSLTLYSVCRQIFLDHSVVFCGNVDILYNDLSIHGICLTVSPVVLQVMEMDISKQLHAYEVEYHVLQDEMLDAGPLLDDSDRLDKLEKTNVQLKKQNMDLLEKLQVRKRRIPRMIVGNNSKMFGI